MNSLRFLRRVSKFSSNTQSFTDDWALDALRSVTTPAGNATVNRVFDQWHRPSGDNAVLEENLMAYGDSLPNRCLSGDYLAICKKTMDEIRPRQKIIPLTLGASMNHPDFPKSTSPGFPWVHRGYHTKRDVLNDPVAVGAVHRTWDSIGRGIPWSLPDCMAYHRVIASEKTKQKIRPVWGFPIEVIAEEARFFLPLMQHLKAACNERDSFYGLGLEAALSGHSHIARSFVECNAKVVLNADMKNFDAHVSNWLMRDIFSFLSDWFDFTKVQDSEGRIWSVSPEQTARRWRAMISYFVNTKIRTPAGTRFQKFQGVPSGSMFTNFIDTCANAIAMRTAIRRCSDSLPLKDYFYGDDSTVLLSGPLDLDELARVLLTVFGMILSVDKTLLSDNVENIHWLGYYYRGTGPARSLDFIVASTIFPERRVDSPLDSATRMLGQLYSCMDPKAAIVFYDAVKYLADKHNFSALDIEQRIRDSGPKAMKFLTTLGLTVEEIVVPVVSNDIFGGRRINAVLPHPCARQHRHRELTLPKYAFVPEAYANIIIRQHGFHDYYDYLTTKTCFDSIVEDEGYFTE